MTNQPQNEDFGFDARAELEAEKRSLQNNILRRLVFVAIVLVGVGLWQLQPDLIYPQALVAVSAALTGVLVSDIVIKTPVMFGLWFALNSKSKGASMEPTSRQKTVTAICAVLPLEVPFYAATGSVLTSLAILVGVFPLVMFISNSLLGSTLKSQAHLTGRMSLARALEDDRVAVRDFEDIADTGDNSGDGGGWGADEVADIAALIQENSRRERA